MFLIPVARIVIGTIRYHLTNVVQFCIGKKKTTEYTCQDKCYSAVYDIAVMNTVLLHNILHTLSMACGSRHCAHSSVLLAHCDRSLPVWVPIRADSDGSFGRSQPTAIFRFSLLKGLRTMRPCGNILLNEGMGRRIPKQFSVWGSHDLPMTLHLRDPRLGSLTPPGCPSAETPVSVWPWSKRVSFSRPCDCLF